MGAQEGFGGRKGREKCNENTVSKISNSKNWMSKIMMPLSPQRRWQPEFVRGWIFLVNWISSRDSETPLQSSLLLVPGQLV